MVRFYDTCSLLNVNTNAFKDGEKFYVSDITLKELEKIKTDRNRDIDIKYKARLLGKMIIQRPECIKVVFYNDEWETELKEVYHMLPNDDARIIITALHQKDKELDLVFTTADVNCYILAYQKMGLECEYVDQPWEDDYLGYKEIKFTSDEEMAKWYEKINLPQDDSIFTNEYVILKDRNGSIIDKYRKGSDGILKSVGYVKFNSKHLGEIKPKDVYQQCAMDSLKNNQFTILRGPAGTGKSLLALSYLFDRLDKGEIDKIVIFCNPVAVRNAAKLGLKVG